MYFKKILLLLYLNVFCFVLIFGKPNDKNLKLELVQVLFRHGARTPINCEAKILNMSESLYEPWGYAQLTNEGMRQEYKIGKMLRERYKDFLPDLYNLKHVYAYASGVTRTKASLELVLAALYPPKDNLTWNPNFNWMPIPIYTNPRPLDILIKSRDCPKYQAALKDLFDTTEMKAAATKHEMILKKMGNILQTDFTFNDVFCGYNALVVNKDINLPLPAWYTDEIFTQLKKAGEFYLDALSYTPTLKRLNGGTFVRKFVENINKSNSKENQRKIYLYSAHDKTLHAFAKANNLNLPITPDYGSAIILEKFRDEQDNFYVRFLLWSGDPKKLVTLPLGHCSDICPLGIYLNMVRPVLPSDDEMLCLFNNLDPKKIEKIFTTDTDVIED